MSRWLKASNKHPCPICGKHDWCARCPDGAKWKCERSAKAPDGWELLSPSNSGGIFQPLAAISGYRHSGGNNHTVAPAQPPTRDWKALVAKYSAAITPEQIVELGEQLGVNSDSLVTVSVGWASRAELMGIRAGFSDQNDNYPDGAYAFPERDGGGRIVGISLRAVDGRKGFPCGAKRGLIIPSNLDRSQTVLIVEGASDVAACITLGLQAVGRPSNSGGADFLAELLEDSDALVLGENDAKPDGSWPGRKGAKSVAQRLAAKWDCPVRWALPVNEVKDLREWLNTKISSGLDLNDAEACQAAGQELLAELNKSAREVRAERKSQADALVDLAHEIFRLGRSDADEPFAVAQDGPNIAIMFRGSREALRATLAREYRRRAGKVPSAAALGDALLALMGEAQELEPEQLYLRLAMHDETVLIDLADTTGRVIIVKSGQWQIIDQSPVLFRRTALTAIIPEPTTGGSLDDFRLLCNVTEKAWPLVLGWMVAALLPDIAHPIMLLTGLQGTGKSTFARMIVELLDPSPATLRSQPKDDHDWAVAASGSTIVTIDNISFIPAWWSDALCRAVSGDGWVARKLYTDADIAVLNFRRSIILTSIDPGALRGDLGDRLLLISLEQIMDCNRRSEAELEEAFQRLRPSITGAVYDLLSKVLEVLPTVNPSLGRMADFCRVLAAVDQVLGTDALKTYHNQRDEIAEDVIESDPVGVALTKMSLPWFGTAGQLLEQLRPDKAGSEWPKTAQGMSGCVRRLVPAMLCAGVRIVPPKGSDKRRMYRIERVGEQTPETPISPTDGEKLDFEANNRGLGLGDPRAISADQHLSNARHTPPRKPHSEQNNQGLGVEGDLGDSIPILSESLPGCQDDDVVPPRTDDDAESALATEDYEW
ncbi:MAG: hypothetical protein HJJLKODD_02304 [Phycisphaerae bacterium]|nr:hypothetical protein [Phycisphaerae bacterium]